MKPPRTACKTCIRRKVKCDEARPKCNRCIKGNFDCGGYLRPQIAFVHATVDRTKVNDPCVKEDWSAVVATSTAPNITDETTDSAALAADHGDGESFASGCPSIIRRGLMIPDRDAMYLTFAIENLLRPAIEMKPFYTTRPSWMEQQAEEHEVKAGNDIYIRALSTAFFGKMHHERSIIKKGSQLYSQALQQLNHNLAKSDPSRMVETLVQTMTMTIYELVVLTVPDAWRLHAKGMSKLFQVAGPSCFHDLRALNVLERSRITIVLDCLLDKRRCFLEEPDWQVIPWQKDVFPKSSLIELHDLMCFLPGLLERMELIKAGIHNGGNPKDYARQLMGLVSDIRLLRAKLDNWRLEWERQCPGSATLMDPTRTRGVSPPAIANTPELFLPQLRFICLEHANNVALYDASCIILMRLESGLADSLGSKSSETAPTIPVWQRQFPTFVPSPEHPLIRPSDNATIVDAAIEICRMVTFHIDPAHSNMGAFSLIFPLRVAWNHLLAYPVAREWAAKVLDRIAKEEAFEVSKRGDNLVGVIDYG